MSKTELKSKAAKVKAAPKAKAEVKAEPKTLFYASTLADALAGKYGLIVQRFYVSACLYHLKQKTVFPRGRNVGHPLLKAEDVPGWLKKHELTSIPPGGKDGQRLFDEMMVETRGAAGSAPTTAPVEPKPAPTPEAAKPAPKAAAVTTSNLVPRPGPTPTTA